MNFNFCAKTRFTSCLILINNGIWKLCNQTRTQLMMRVDIAVRGVIGIKNLIQSWRDVLSEDLQLDSQFVNFFSNLWLQIMSTAGINHSFDLNRFDIFWQQTLFNLPREMICEIHLNLRVERGMGGVGCWDSSTSGCFVARVISDPMLVKYACIA